MEIEGVKRVAYWGSLFIFVALMGIFSTSDKLSVVFRLILIVLLALLSSMFRLADRYSFISIALVVIAGLFMGMMLAENGANAQFWSFAFVFVVAFFLFCEVWVRNILEI